ncbi:uncharacterized protein SCDLUD_000018 [Saccharomycodes ludwigii]|uniref:uncharacterized protein n=1 Tax=Saccharomycodes ludwigii TaxID=36035 RepID=UPI001E872CC8|nr:hypothetical protein SCDLUD_000018 [Saccharomycodes ludwigii]KAH3902441.1 hypothetical protein SCDLUD_000018 [Saccharomycodes ludwigii]
MHCVNMFPAQATKRKYSPYAGSNLKAHMTTIHGIEREDLDHPNFNYLLPKLKNSESNYKRLFIRDDIFNQIVCHNCPVYKLTSNTVNNDNINRYFQNVEHELQEKEDFKNTIGLSNYKFIWSTLNEVNNMYIDLFQKNCGGNFCGIRIEQVRCFPHTSGAIFDTIRKNITIDKEDTDI